jgi:hypothetical protein
MPNLECLDERTKQILSRIDDMDRSLYGSAALSSPSSAQSGICCSFGFSVRAGLLGAKTR